MSALHENWFFPSSHIKIFQLTSTLVTSLDVEKPVFHAALALGQNPGIANLVILVMLIYPVFVSDYVNYFYTYLCIPICSIAMYPYINFMYIKYLY